MLYNIINNFNQEQWEEESKENKKLVEKFII
jgi:hypothetical protein